MLKRNIQLKAYLLRKKTINTAIKDQFGKRQDDESKIKLDNQEKVDGTKRQDNKLLSH